MWTIFSLRMPRCGLGITYHVLLLDRGKRNGTISPQIKRPKTEAA